MTTLGTITVNVRILVGDRAKPCDWRLRVLGTVAELLGIPVEIQADQPRETR